MSYRLLRIKDVVQITGLSRSSIYKFIEEGKFPKQIYLSQRTVAWSKADIDEWVQSRINQTGGCE